MREQQRRAAEASMIEWLSHSGELGKAPAKIECTKEFDLHDLHYYVFRFKAKMLGEWMLGVCGGYEGDELDHCGHVFSQMEKYNDRTAIEDAAAIVESIRAYWMERARQQEEFERKFRANVEFRMQKEIPAQEIADQFVKTQSRYFLTVGEVDCPSGRIVVSDPLAYLPDSDFILVLEKKIPAGRYPVEVSICRNDEIGLRMCTAKLKVKDTEAVSYERAAGLEADQKGKDLEGFPVDAGMMSFCDEQTAREYRDFLLKWHSKNPEGNHYDDYFAAFFARSYEALPAYQREGGDFIEWQNPDTGNRMVMIASGLGDGFYSAYYGYDSAGEICQIIVPMVNPSLFSTGE